MTPIEVHSFVRCAVLVPLLATLACDGEEPIAHLDTEEAFADRSAPPTWCDAEDGREEFFVFDAINGQLADDEGLRSFAGFEHVSSCEEAREFVAAKNEYQEQQPPLAEQDATEELEYPVEEAPRIANGSSSKFEPSVNLTIWSGTGWTSAGSCTGFIIGPREIVTAAHCIPADKKRPVRVTVRQPLGSLGTIDACVANCSGVVENAQGYRHPNYTGAGDSGDDVGVFVFDSDFGTFASHAVDRVRMMVNTTWNGAPIDVYGWGRNTQSGGGGVAREGDMTVSWAGSKHFTANATGTRACRGDSGGPAVRTSVTDHPLVVGVHSERAGNIGPGCPYSDGFNRWMQVGPKIPWIEARIGRSCNRYTSQTNSSITYARCW